MKIYYTSQRNEKLFTSEKKLKKKFGKDCAEIIMRRIVLFSALDNMNDLYEALAKPRLHFHPLTANYQGKYAVRVNAKLRIILEPYPEESDETVDDLKTIHAMILLEIEDYHEN
ncbi:MAG: type II toxin-antitoxin system RelE/ParE family toxin [Planctomycetia bacterium]|nr:type II toxin-antitoxin system RelE/ParE family toxin [Planctomycetia bacterium]